MLPPSSRSPASHSFQRRSVASRMISTRFLNPSSSLSSAASCFISSSASWIWFNLRKVPLSLIIGECSFFLTTLLTVQCVNKPPGFLQIFGRCALERIERHRKRERRRKGSIRPELRGKRVKPVGRGRRRAQEEAITTELFAAVLGSVPGTVVTLRRHAVSIARGGRNG